MNSAEVTSNNALSKKDLAIGKNPADFSGGLRRIFI